LVAEPTRGNVSVHVPETNDPDSGAGVRNASPSVASSPDVGSAVEPNEPVACNVRLSSFEKFVIATVPFVHPLVAVAVVGAEPPSWRFSHSTPAAFASSMK
jgi:hypothetical protein